ncbi:MAG TPA: mechanosensitive ion channel family protein [Gemmatimonadales bacterium]|nr:mechanosensitive ion channel family protein [Gemmatimonadales bacterium]
MHVALLLPGWLTQLGTLLDIDARLLIQRGLRLAVVWAGAWVAIKLVNLLARRIVKAVDDGDDRYMTLKEKRGYTLAQLLRSVGRFVVLIFTLILSLGVFVNVTPLLAGAGVVGLAISFGAQSLVKDFFAGFFILLEDQFSVGDVVDIEGRSGVVERMTLRLTQLRSLDGTLHSIPNGTITVVSNRTRGWSRAVLEVAVAYGTDVDRALEVLRDEVAAFARDEEWSLTLDGAPEVWGVEALGDSAVTIRIVARTRPGQQWAVARELRRRIKKRLDQEGIEIPFPQRAVHVRVDQAPRLPGAGAVVAQAAAEGAE